MRRRDERPRSADSDSGSGIGGIGNAGADGHADRNAFAGAGSNDDADAGSNEHRGTYREFAAGDLTFTVSVTHRTTLSQPVRAASVANADTGDQRQHRHRATRPGESIVTKWIAIALAICIAGCSGASGGSTLTQTPPAPPAGAGTTSASIVLKIPTGSTSSSTTRRAQFVGAAVSGVSLQFFLHSDSTHANVVGGGSFTVSSASGSCTPATGIRSCTLTVATQVGTEDVVVTTYDAAPVAGSFAAAHQLGTGTIYSVAFTSTGPNAYNVAVGGTIASIVLSPASTSLSGNSAGSYSLGYTAYDAAGEAIIAGANTVTNGAGNTETDTYSNPMTVRASEAGGSGHTKLALNGGSPATSIAVTTSSATITVSYDGLATSGYAATFTATAAGATQYAAELVLNFGGLIYVANQLSNSITVYPANPSGTTSEAPIATIAGSNTGLNVPDGIAFDSSGRIYVTNRGANSITVYPPNPAGTLNEAPVATIAGGNTGLGSPEGLTLDPGGNIYVSNYYNNFSVFAANPIGTLNEAPIATVSGSNTNLAGGGGIALDPTGNVYVVNGNANTVTVYAPNPSGNVAPTATINGTGSFNGADGIALDASGRIYVASESYGIVVLPANPTGSISAAPTAVIQGLNVAPAAAVALDPSGKVYVASFTHDSVEVYPANPVGTLNENPLGYIYDPVAGNTALDWDIGIAIH